MIKTQANMARPGQTRPGTRPRHPQSLTRCAMASIRERILDAAIDQSIDLAQEVR
jgi:hypothetical protein